MFECNTTVILLHRTGVSDGTETFREEETSALVRETLRRNGSDLSRSRDATEFVLPPECEIDLDDAIRWNGREFRLESVAPRRDLDGKICGTVCRTLS